MKTRKLIILCMAVVVCMIASCKKDEETPTNSVVFRASIESYGEAGDDKTAIDTITEYLNNKGRVVWSEDDQIRIHNGTTSHIFTLISEAGSTHGDFCFNGGYLLTDNYLAAYPTTGQITFNSSTAQVVFNLPATQNLGEADSTFANGANPMVAKAAYIDSLNFKNACGGIGIRLRGAVEDITVSNIRITSKNSNDCLWGNLAVTMNNDGTINNTFISNEAANKNVIDLNCNIALSTTKTKRVFIVLPAGTLSQGFTLYVTYKVGGGEDQIVYLTTSSDPNVADDATVERNKLKSLPVIDIGSGTHAHAFMITASANPIEGGTVEGDGIIQEGQSCTLTATANTGYAFSHWRRQSDNSALLDNPLTFDVNANDSYVAGFVPADPDFHPLTTPLTFEAFSVKTTGASVTFEGELTVQYSLNGGTWENYTDTINLSSGDKVSFRGNNASYDGSHLSCTGECYIYGNIMSLIDADYYPTTTELTEESTFAYLFQNNSSIYNHPTKALELPATSLAPWCYSNMFEGCTNLTTAPALPATNLTEYEYCYMSMFSYCTSLETAPDLPATTLAKGCYEDMFLSCISLSTAPELPATTLADDCYSGMFRECIGLITAPELSATNLAENCYLSMFEACIGLTAAPALPATNLADGCYTSMFKYCEKLETAPLLPASTLVDNCYNNMFYGCIRLNSVTCLATSISAWSCTYKWLNGVASSGTFTKASTMSSWPIGPNNYGNVSGIPSGWTVVDYNEP